MDERTILKKIGYWAGGLDEEAKNYIHPCYLIDPLWHIDEKCKIIGYLKGGIPVEFSMGYSFCRFEDGPPCNEMGTMDLTDGEWLWPEGLFIYVERYNIRLPEEFVEHMKHNGYKIPEEKEIGGKFVESDEFWIEWGRNQILNSNHNIGDSGDSGTIE